MKPPIRVKLYGLVSVTKFGYLMQLGLVAVLLLVLLGVWAKLPPWHEVQNPAAGSGMRNLPPESVRLVSLLYNIPWIVLAIAVLVALEAFFVLRRFAREEALRRAKAAPQPESPRPPT